MTIGEKENGKTQDTHPSNEEKMTDKERDQKTKDAEWEQHLQSVIDSMEDEVCR